MEDVVAIVGIIRDLLLIVSALAVLYMVAQVVRRLQPIVRDTREMAQQVVRASQTVEKQSERLGQTLTSVQALADTLVEVQEERVEPILANLEKMSIELNESVREITAVVREGSKFTHETVRQVAYYRDRVFRPFIEAASLWTGARAVLKALPVGRKIASRRKKELKNG